MENAATKNANASTDDKPIDPKSAQCIRIPLHGPPIHISTTEPSIQIIENGGIVIHDAHKIDITTNDAQVIVQMAEEPTRRTPGHVANVNAENDVSGCNGEAVIEVEIDEGSDGLDEIPLNRRNKIKVLQKDGDDDSSKPVL